MKFDRESRVYMIKSMTGFGRWEHSSEERKIIIEIKAVNHRYCDINVRLPKKFFYLEPKVSNLIKQYVKRGKIDVFITYTEYINSSLSVKYNEDLAAEYLNIFDQMKEKFNLDNDIKVSSLSRYPEVLTLEEQSNSEDEIWPILEEVVSFATKNLVESRSLEGKNLKYDMLLKLEDMDKYSSFIEEKSPQIVEEHYNNLKAKVEELLGDTQIEESILATEVATFADKVCVDEEIVRLNSHITNMRDTLNNDSGDNGVGRKLDFIAQEMNREANTILSKVNDIEVTNVAIELKTVVEKVREQIQNIE